MTPEGLQLIGQLGLSGLLFYLLLEERKARIAEVAIIRQAKNEADKRYFDFMERLVLRSIPNPITPHDEGVGFTHEP